MKRVIFFVKKAPNLVQPRDAQGVVGGLIWWWHGGAVRLSGINHMVLTKLDVLTGLKEIKVATTYRREGRLIQHPPSDSEGLEVVYETLQGWDEPISHITRFDELPKAAKAYIRFIENEVGVHFDIVSVGAERSQNIFMPNSLFETSH